MKKLTDKQKKNLDKTGDGKLTKEDFLLVRRLKKKNTMQKQRIKQKQKKEGRRPVIQLNDLASRAAGI